MKKTPKVKPWYIWDLDFYNGKVSRIGPFHTANSAEEYAEEMDDSNHQYMVTHNDKPLLKKPKSNKEV